MRVYVNDQPIDLAPGTTVRHALISAGCLADLSEKNQVCDEWGNLLGLDGALIDEMKIFLK
jgi:hypothetical protein